MVLFGGQVVKEDEWRKVATKLLGEGPYTGPSKPTEQMLKTPRGVIQCLEVERGTSPRVAECECLATGTGISARFLGDPSDLGQFYAMVGSASSLSDPFKRGHGELHEQRSPFPAGGQK